MSATPAEVETHIRSLITSMEDRTQRLAEARSALKRSERQWRRQAEAAVAFATEAAGKDLKRDRKSIEANVHELRTSALGVATNVLEQQAPGYLSADWSDKMWTELPTAQAGEWVRIGATAIGNDKLALALPLSAGSWSVVGPDTDAFRYLVHNVIARLVAAFDPPRVRVIAYDPNLNLDLAAFASLREVSQDSVPPAITSEEEFEQALERLRTDLVAVDDRLTANGHHTYWSALAAQHALAATTPIRLLIVGSTSLLSDKAVARLDQMRRLASDRGLLIIESVKSAPTSVSAKPTVITLAASDAATSAVPGINWTPDSWAGDSFIRTLSAQLVDRPRQSLAPTVDFEAIVDAIDDPWMAETEQGIEAVIGTIDGGDLVVRLRSEDPPMPNALVGGAVGQGKSNLLLVLIHSLAARYSPAELEMVLVDLRDGVEFARLGPTVASPTWLPHVRALGLEFDPDYSLAVLRWVKDQLPLRSRELQAHGATTLKKYQENTGRAMPRLLVVIDEFQRLFEGGDEQAETAAALLGEIARTGRGFGVHVVLASQAITGIQGLATTAQAMFDQFHNRVVLKTGPAESQAFLTAHNTAAADLEYRGQAVFNDALGSTEKNKVGTIAHAKPEYLEQLQVQLYQQGHGTAPNIFRATTFAQWPTGATSPSPPNGVAASVGMPIAVEAEPRRLTLTRSPNQALAVVGSNREVAVAALVRAVVTAAQSIGPNARLTILDGDSPGEAPNAWIGALVDHLTKRGIVVDRISRDKTPAKLIELGREKGLTDLVVAIALDSVDLASPVEPDFAMPNDSLRELVRSGPLNGTWTLGWWQSKPILEDHLGYRAPGVRAWAFAGVSRDDLTDIAGHAVREPSGSPRVVWFDRTAGSGAERLVPFAVTDVIGVVDLV